MRVKNGAKQPEMIEEVEDTGLEVSAERRLLAPRWQFLWGPQCVAGCGITSLQEVQMNHWR